MQNEYTCAQSNKHCMSTRTEQHTLAPRLSFAFGLLQNHNSITVKEERNVLNTNLQRPIHSYSVNPEDNNVSLGEMGDQYPH